MEQNQLDIVRPDMFANLTTLKLLQLSRNYIHTLEVGIFQGLTSLTSLLMTVNPGLLVLPAGLFSDCHNLDNINLKKNALDTIEPYSLHPLPLLTWLNLYDNKIRVVYSHMFVNLTALWYLNLRRNFLHMIEPNSFQGRLQLNFVKMLQGSMLRPTLKKASRCVK